jgi:signal transduction histidine kinase
MSGNYSREDGQDLWSGEFIDSGLEDRFRRSTYAALNRQLVLIAVIILVVSGPMMIADHLKAADFPYIDLFTAIRILPAMIACGWIVAAKYQLAYRHIDALVFVFVFYMILEAFFVMFLFRADFIVALSRMALFIMLANMVLPVPGRSRVAMNAVSLCLSLGAIWGFAALTRDTAVTLSVMMGATYLFGLVAGIWLARTRRADYLTRLELEQANSSLVQSHRDLEIANRSRNVFLSNISHELRTPLNAVIGFSDVLEKQMFGPLGNARYHEYVGDIRNSGQHLLSLINDLLDLNRLDAGKAEMSPEWVALGPAAEEWTKLVCAAVPAAQAEDLRCSDIPDVEIWFDRRALKQIMVNLMTNASKYAGDGSRIDLEANFGRTGKFHLGVVDNGHGMDPEALANLLKPFEQADGTTSRAQEGWGLGLPLANALTTANQARLSIRSKPGHGTSAMIILPENAVRRAQHAPEAGLARIA